MAGLPMKDRDPLANTEVSDTRDAGEAEGAERMHDGVGAAAKHMVQATRTGKYPNDNTGGQRSQGETAGSGSIYAAVLNERPNLSNPRNQGPVRAPSRMGSSVIPVMNVEQRNTGKKS